MFALVSFNRLYSERSSCSANDMMDSSPARTSDIESDDLPPPPPRRPILPLPSFKRRLVAASSPKRPARIALQNEDEDVVVITCLDTLPFNSHQELVAMNRGQLVAVAEALNSKLSIASQIDVGPQVSDVDIRTTIEVLVGIRRPIIRRHNLPTPNAPNPARSRGRVRNESPTSPLANHSRTRTYSSLVATPVLESLAEEDESMEHHVKRRRVVFDQCDTPCPPPRKRLHGGARPQRKAGRNVS